MRFRIDKSGIPKSKLNSRRVRDYEESIQQDLADDAKRLQTCLHEAAHAMYMERAGFAWSLRGPEISYDSKHRRFHASCASVVMNSKGRTINLMTMARIDASGGVGEIVLGHCKSDGNDQDFRDFLALGKQACKENHIPVSDFDLVDDWCQAQREVVEDLKNPDFQKQIWDRAHDFNRQLIAEFGISEPAGGGAAAA